jgi:hypothetical protein
MSCTDTSLQYDREIIRNRDKAYDLVFNSTDITGWTVYMSVKINKDDLNSEALLYKIVTNHTSPTEGQTTIELNANETDIPAGTYWYDISYKDETGEIITINWGRFKVIQNITEIS